MQAGVNLEFARSEGFSLDEALGKAAEAGYDYVEPYVYSRVCADQQPSRAGERFALPSCQRR